MLCLAWAIHLGVDGYLLKDMELENIRLAQRETDITGLLVGSHE